MHHIDIHHLLNNINHYATPLLKHGSLALFVLVALGVFALPIPDESLMLAAGFFMAKGKLLIAGTLPAAYLGSMSGITLSYSLGRTVGSFMVKKLAHYLGITPEKIEYVETWFERIGSWTLFVGYFVPGVRHLTGYVAGTLELSYRRFAIYAYCGALIWASTWLFFGFFLGLHY